MTEEKSLPKPELDLPLPEKELTAGDPKPEQTSTVYVKNESTDEKPHRVSHLLISFLFGFLFVVLVVLIGGGAFFLGKNSNNNSIPTPSPAPVVYEPTPTPDPTADWKTFEGDGFTFKYPNSAKKLPDDSVNYINLQLASGDIFHILAQNNSKNLSARDWLDQEFPKSEAVKFNNIIIAGKDSVQKNDYSVTHINPADGKMISIGFVKCDGPGCGAGVDTKSIQDILSTFKFTDSEPACTPRPSCLDSTPACKIPETSDMCPPSPTP